MFEHGFPSHWSTIRKLMWLKRATGGGASAVWKTVTGAFIHITDALSSPTQKFEVTLEPIQSGSGDPSPTNVRPITGWTGTTANVSGADTSDPTTYSVTFPALGKNLCNPDAIEQVYTTASNIRNGIEFSKVGTYVVSASDYNSGSIRVKYRFSDGTFASASIISDSETKTYKKYTVLENEAIIVYDNSSSNTIDQSKALFEAAKIQLEEGNSQTSFEPYTNTVYGCTFDFDSGVLTVEMEYIEITGSNLESLSTTSHASGTTVAYTYEIQTMRNIQQRTLCDSLKTGSYGSGTLPANSIAFGRSNYKIYLCIEQTLVGTTLDSFKTYLNAHPIHAVYNLITPVEYNITPKEISTLAGENNVWGDGTIEMTYKARA